MTKVIINVEENGSFFFDCENHSEDHDVCTIASTLCNVVAARCHDKGYKIDEYRPGHVRVTGESCDSETGAILRTVLSVFEQVQEQNPDFIKVY